MKSALQILAGIVMGLVLISFVYIGCIHALRDFFGGSHARITQVEVAHP